jgi:hypothetical protein
MRRSRLAALALVALLVTGAGYLALVALGVFAPTTAYRPVPAGHQEIVFLAPATSGDTWERLVAAVDALHDESDRVHDGRPKILLDKRRAFVDLTADVPEVSLWLEGAEDARLWIRWYKLSAENNSERWVKLLTERGTPPLAFVGGDTSFRALRVAQALERHKGDWHGNAPLLLLSTATADRYIPNDVGNSNTVEDRWPRLIDIYHGRSFRFAFTNARMATMVLDFIRSHDDQLWPGAAPNDALVAARLMAADPVQGAALSRAADDRLTPYLYTLKWDDDSFSADLADRFRFVFHKKFPLAREVSPNQIEYSVGDFYQPNPSEAFVAGQLLPELEAMRDHRQLMLLPANAERARRFLRTLIRRSTPQDWRNLVVITGDSLNFNTIYRDRDVAWNIQDLPVPLVLFSHRNPVDEEVGFREGAGAAGTGTEDLLLYRDILEALLLTAYQGPRLAGSADEVLRGFRALGWAGGRVKAAGDKARLLFNPQGDRHDGTGEHIVVLQPDADDRGRLAQATVTVWHLAGDPALAASWRQVRSLRVVYDSLPSDRPG